MPESYQDQIRVMSVNHTGLPIPLLIDDEHSAYGYRPTFWICILYVALFSTTLVIHVWQTISSRYWFLVPTVILGAVLEVLGWAGRLWSSRDLGLRDPFMMQICCLILGPTPLLAANFVIFGRLVGALGEGFSRLRPRFYTYVFLSCDIVSLVLQGIAGGFAATADPGTSQYDLGTNLMVAGIGLQVAMMTIFVILVGEYTVRYINDRPLKRYRTTQNRSTGTQSMRRFPLDTRRQVLLFAMGITTLLLFIRAIYRLIELSGGWQSQVARTQWLFNVFDAALVTVAFFTWNVAHPSRLLVGHPGEIDVRMKEKTGGALDRSHSGSDESSA
ncbi:hypothetical protein E1B28_001875 [Marasmius oreades]|uniref:RTA1-domain-containing protein n=1 Tax=Marasmius oreades TaxID=181124 RepID=A0A9P8AG86_9AGAR|nr:uncharacterized protein E1B28_001875 [Marasmius oreades]KAG7100095.1 hypothetical protein E1B28_001875 [Marasmius oreades]